MRELEQGGESLHEVMPELSVYQSTQIRIVNLNQLIRIHRIKQKYQIWDKFYNNSYLSIDNKVLPIEAYSSIEKFKPYIEDLNLIYFKDIEFNENVRLEHIIRRLNFTLNGEHYDFIEFLKENKFYDPLFKIYSEQSLGELENSSNDKKTVNLRNSLFLSFLLHQLSTYDFTRQQSEVVKGKIKALYFDLKKKMCNQHEVEQSEEVLSQHRYQCLVNSITNQSQKSHEREEDEENESNLIKYIKDSLQPNKNSSDLNQKSYYQNEEINTFFDDVLYEEEIQLKIIEIQIENFYFKNQMNDSSTSEEYKFKLQYLFEINKEYIDRLIQLKKLNNHNRHLLKKIQRNISLQFSTGSKCIVINESRDISQCFGELQKFQSVQRQRESKVQKAKDSQVIQHITLNIINKLRLKQIADSIEKVHQIQRFDNKNSKHNGRLVFNVSFERGLGLNEAVFHEKDFLMLNDLREESTLTSYLTPMKSRYSYISHNIFAFMNIYEPEKEFPYDKEVNNNEEILKKIKNKISRHRNLGKAEIKQFYYQNFKMCHNCKILCQKQFTKQCKRRVKHQKHHSFQNGEQADDDSLYTERENKHKRLSGQYIIECQKNYCLFCIKNQFEGKLFNEKGWCPACLDYCHCNTCLRSKMIQKLIDLYIFSGGQSGSIRSEKEIIEDMRVSRSTERCHSEVQQQQNLNFSDSDDDKVYEQVIKKQIIKSYSAHDVESSLRQQEEIISMIIDQETIKLDIHVNQRAIFRQKIKMMNASFEVIDKEIEKEKEVVQKQRELKYETEREEVKKRKRERRDLSKSAERRKCRKILRDEEVYYDYIKFDISSSSQLQSSFHIKKGKSRFERRKCKDSKYEPQYNF